MSTFTTSPVSPAFAPAFGDDMLVRDLRKDTDLLMLPRLNADLHMQLSIPVYSRIRQFYGDTARRDPTIGELRLLDALDRYGKESPRRIAVGELTTQDSALAETWASMMGLHGSLHGVGTTRHGREAVAAPPCSLTDALSLTGYYLNRTATRHSPPLLLASPAQEAEAAACGYSLTARVAVDDRSYTLWTCKTPLIPLPVRKGDFILYLPRVEPLHMQAFVAEIAASAHPFPYDVRAVADRSLLGTLLDMVPSVDLYADRLTGNTAAAERMPAALLCQSPTVGADGVCDYLLRTPVKQVQTVTEALKRQGISSAVCGRVTGNRTTSILVRNSRTGLDTPLVNLPSRFLTGMSATYLYTYGEESPATAASPAPVSPTVTRLPSIRHGENGVTPHGYTAVALTRNEGALLRIPEAGILTSSLAVTISQPGTAFATTARTVAEVTDTLASASVSPAEMALSVTLTVPDTDSLLRGSTLAAICGIYRVAAERGLPVREPLIDVDPTRELTATVIAYGPEDPSCTATEDSDDRQWRASEESCHKESPGFLLPVIRRPYEGCLKALSAALGRDAAARCIIRPVVMDSREVEIPAPPDAEEENALPRKETHYILNPDSVRKFCEQLHEWFTPIFCMNEEDTRTLLSEPAVLDALNRLIDVGYPVIVLGESCKPFAEHGFLPAALTEVQPLAVSWATATVTYAAPLASSTRLLRGKLLSVPELSDTSSLLTLHLPDGTAVPDGFVGLDGKVLGILNGVDTAILPLLRRHSFDHF